jgi:soluble lytic murein transglycosylase
MAHLYAGMARHDLGQYPEALEEFDVVVDDFAWTEAAGEAWMAKARTVAALGGDSSTVYLEFAARYASHVRAPEALWLAAMAFERRGDWELATETYALLGREYGGDWRGQEAAFRAGLAAYAVGDNEQAIHLWQHSLSAKQPGAEGYLESRARTLTWMGLASARAEDPGAAQAWWREAADAAPASYYGLRAGSWLDGDALRMPAGTGIDVPESQLTGDDWHQIEKWVEGWSQVETGLQGPIQDQLLVRRAATLWELGWHDEAMAVYRQFRDQIIDHPPALLTLTRHCYETDVWAMVIPCAERLIAMGRSAGADHAPNALWRAAYPTPYGHLIGKEAAIRDLDPLLVLALLRQESLFNPNVNSWAGAVGLAQVMPETGAWIAERLGEESFDGTLLLRPRVSIRYGCWYLGEALELFDRSGLAAVASYNAGWANVQNWLGEDAATDPDWFYETIPFTESKAFVRLVYEHLHAYQRVYRE